MTSATSLPDVRIQADAEQVADAAAEEIARALSAAVEARGRADWVTTGGSAAAPIYRRLAARPLRDAVDWSKVHVWWGDDRFVPYDHPLSNVLPFEQILLASTNDEGAPTDAAATGPGVRIPAENIHRIATTKAIAEARGAAWAAHEYAEELAAAGPETRTADGTPVMDLLVVGVGPDGHILSVFPGSAVWDAAELAAAVPAPTHIEPHVERVTMHPALADAAREVLVVCAGAPKAGAFGRAWVDGDPRDLPARVTRRGGAVWVIDAAAAADLPMG